MAPVVLMRTIVGFSTSPRSDRMSIMNTYSVTGAAALLGTSRRRVLSAADTHRIGTLTGGRRTFTDTDIDALRTRLGHVTDIPTLTRSETLVLAELARRPRGLNSARAVARATDLAPATAAKAVRSLLAAHLIVERDEVVPLGRAVRVRSLHANPRHPQWGHLLPALRDVSPPNPDPDTSGDAANDPIPAHLRHAFWNVDDATLARLTPAQDGPFIAARALTTGDPDLIAYATATLPASAWARAERTRGLAPDQRAMAHNLATTSS